MIFITNPAQQVVPNYSTERLTRQRDFLNMFCEHWANCANDENPSEQDLKEGVLSDLLSSWLWSEGYDDICADDLRTAIVAELNRRPKLTNI